MGISTLQSYQSARIFEAIGLGKDVIDRYFTGTVSRVGGIGIKEIEEGVAFRHDHAFDPLGLGVDETLDSVGFHYLRSGRDKEDHMYSPETIIALQRAVRTRRDPTHCAVFWNSSPRGTLFRSTKWNPRQRLLSASRQAR